MELCVIAMVELCVSNSSIHKCGALCLARAPKERARATSCSPEDTGTASYAAFYQGVSFKNVRACSGAGVQVAYSEP